MTDNQASEVGSVPRRAAPPPALSSGQRRALGGLVVRQECWRVSWGGKLLLLALGIGVAVVGMRTIHPFLATTRRSGGNLLLVEGWIASYTMAQVADEFRRGRYEQVLVMRAVDDSLGDKYESGRYVGEYMANSLIRCGVPAERVNSVFCPVSRKDRTFHSALAAKQWLAQRGISVNSMDVATLGPHARRSRLLCEKAFGRDVKVGIIALEDRAYDPSHWWRSSEGVREVLGEAIAYGYVRIFFHPPPASQAR